jgi:bifunctional oligoribonuclease and PAP phosphatase NrnA
MLKSIAQRLMEGRKIVLLHGNADPDALGCAYALYRGFPDVTIAALGGLDRVSKVVAANLEFEVKEIADLNDYDLVVGVDTSSMDQLGVDITGRNCIIIDHHARNCEWTGCTFYGDESKRSCAEIIFELFKAAGKEIDRKSGLALAAGMLTDSGHFRFANAALLHAFAELLETTGLNIDEVIDLTDLEPDVSERIAQLKGAQRLRFERIGDCIVAISQGSSFESSVSKSLLTLGADVAFVGSQRDERFRISARARQEMVRKGLHLGKFLDEIAGETQNNGGGHAGAAGLSGVGDVEATLNICISKTMSFFRANRSNEGREPTKVHASETAQ